MRRDNYFVGRENREFINQIVQYEIREEFAAAEDLFYHVASYYKSFSVWCALLDELQRCLLCHERQIKMGIVYLLLAQLSIQRAEEAIVKKDFNDLNAQKKFADKHFKNAAQFFRTAGDSERADRVCERHQKIISSLSFH